MNPNISGSQKLNPLYISATVAAAAPGRPKEVYASTIDPSTKPTPFGVGEITTNIRPIT
jgi:hypothetical protein